MLVQFREYEPYQNHEACQHRFKKQVNRTESVLQVITNPTSQSRMSSLVNSTEQTPDWKDYPAPPSIKTMGENHPCHETKHSSSMNRLPQKFLPRNLPTCARHAGLAKLSKVRGIAPYFTSRTPFFSYVRQKARWPSSHRRNSLI